MYRSELKFLVDESTLQIMQNKLKPLLLYDSHQKEDSYRIRSMYFDTYERKSYRENDAGVEERNIEFVYMTIPRNIFVWKSNIN